MLGPPPGLFKDRRQQPSPQTKDQLRSHLEEHHEPDGALGQRMSLSDLQELHDDAHQMPTSHGHDDNGS